MCRTALVALALLCCAFLLFAQQIEGPIPTPIDQWQPVLSGQWSITTKRFDSSGVDSPQTKQNISACPYSSLLFLNPSAPIKLGEAGCQFRAYRISKTQFHIAARCKALRGPDHYETTTLLVSPNGRAFSSATTWIESKGSVTIRSEGTLTSECKKD